jgi:hypothetical protein
VKLDEISGPLLRVDQDELRRLRSQGDAQGFASHSLRSGFLTSAAEAGAAFL